MKWLLRVAGVNFDATVYDTHELSTIRGGSLALLELHRVVQDHLPSATKIYSGASEATYSFSADEDEIAGLRDAVADDFAKKRFHDLEMHAEVPFRYLNFVIDVVAWDSEGSTHQARAEACNRSRQFRQWTVDALAFDPKGGGRIDPFDHFRPAKTSVLLPRGKILTLDEDDDRKTDETVLSASVAARRAYGRKARQMFYRKRLGNEAETILGPLETGYSFTDNLVDMVADRPEGVLPVSLHEKIAVVYADGNSFGKIRDDIGAAVFAEQIERLRSGLLKRVLTWYEQGAANGDHARFAIRRDSHSVHEHYTQRFGLRFETLLWGGDELVFVMPAWLVFGFLKGLCADIKGWTINGKSLTHAIGVVIAHHKTPIRQLRRLAAESADMAKDAGMRVKNSVTVDIFESLSPPDIDMATFRAALYGYTATEINANAMARALALPGDAFEQVCDQMAALKGMGHKEGFPRSQLYGALRKFKMSLPPEGFLVSASETISEYLEDYKQRPDGLKNCDLLQQHCLPTCDCARGMPLDLALITQLWDYIHPFGDPLPDFPNSKVTA